MHKTMDRCATLGLIVMLLLAWNIAGAHAQEPAGKFQSMYADVKAKKVGDLLQVLISESNSASKNAQTSTNKQNSSEVAGEATTGALSGLFPGMGGSMDLQSQYNGQASTTRRGTLSSRITVQVVDVLPNNYLVIEGSKTMEINNDYEVVTISGVVDPRYISATNSVQSSQVANAKIIYKGKGSVTQGNRIGILGRIINWIF